MHVGRMIVEVGLGTANRILQQLQQLPLRIRGKVFGRGCDSVYWFIWGMIGQPSRRCSFLVLTMIQALSSTFLPLNKEIISKYSNRMYIQKMKWNGAVVAAVFKTGSGEGAAVWFWEAL